MQFFKIISVKKFFAGITAFLVLSSFMGMRYGEDIKVPGLAPHSTFHYEMTRTLARAAGFSTEQAELIAVVDEATDAGDFAGENGIEIELQGTERSGPNGLYWHFARRGAQNVTGEYTYPGMRNTCEYFAGTDQSCPDGQPELNEIENWAVYGTATPSPGAPQISGDGGKTFANVQGKSPEALAIYLHALADSYSHEACMRVAQFRGHKPLPPECSAVYWHEQAEYGDQPARDIGVEYTREAAWATWLALKWYRVQNQVPGSLIWSDAQAYDFIEQWVHLDSARERRELAVQIYHRL